MSTANIPYRLSPFFKERSPSIQLIVYSYATSTVDKKTLDFNDAPSFHLHRRDNLDQYSHSVDEKKNSYRSTLE